MPGARLLIAAVLVSVTTGDAVCAQPAGTDALLEIRSYQLKAGERERFADLFVRESLPLLRRHHIDVVAFGPSLHDPDAYYLMRAFSSLAERDRQEDAFYNSPEWYTGARP